LTHPGPRAGAHKAPGAGTACEKKARGAPGLDLASLREDYLNQVQRDSLSLAGLGRPVRHP